MTLEIQKREWGKFFSDLSKRRFEWKTKVEVMNDSIGNQILSEGLPLIGITAEERAGNTVVTAVGESPARHQTHNVTNPTKIAFLGKGEMGTGNRRRKRDKDANSFA